jgi:hypothetical protein
MTFFVVFRRFSSLEPLSLWLAIVDIRDVVTVQVVDEVSVGSGDFVTFDGSVALNGSVGSERSVAL